jgi:hypothetical protein
MPFFIPIMIAASVASMIPSFLPKKEQQAQGVIDQTGANYFRRQTWRTGNRAGSISHGNHKQNNPYGSTISKHALGININQILVYAGVAVGIIVLLKILTARRRS